MSTIYTLTTPASVGTITNPKTVASLQITGLQYTSTPQLAPIGTGQMIVTLTDPASGWQETVTYNDASVLTLWASPVTASAGETLGDVISAIVLAKIQTDGLIPPGTIVTTNPAPATSTTPATNTAS